MNVETLAKQLYEAYGKNAQWQNYHGGAMPTWNELPVPIQSNWIYVARIAYETCNTHFIEIVREKLCDISKDV